MLQSILITCLSVHATYPVFDREPSRSYTYLQSGFHFISLPFSCFVYKLHQFPSCTAKYRQNKLKHRCCRPQMAVKVILTCLICFHSLKKVFNLPCSRSLEKLCLALFFKGGTNTELNFLYTAL